MILLKVFCFALVIWHSQSDVVYYGPYSSCQTPTQWIKESGPPIKSWIRSIVSLLPDSPVDIFATPIALKATFTRTYNREYVKDITNTRLNITWRIHGKSKFDGWLYGKTYNGSFVGDDVAYIYQDLTTVLIGKFADDDKMIAAKEARIVAYRCNDGIMELKFSKPKKDAFTFTYERMTTTFISSALTVMDPHDRRHVYINNSTLQNLTKGDGLFAKRFIPAHSLVAIYAGYFIDVNATYTYNNMTAEEKEDAHKNIMSYNDTHNLNLPPELTDILDYRASLGHKVNNAFKDKQNTEFCFINHPRFGHCRCIRSTKAIGKGEEIFIDYGYDATEEGAPLWYIQLYNETFGGDTETDYTSSEDDDARD